MLPILLTARTEAKSPLIAKRSHADDNTFDVHRHIFHRRADADAGAAAGSKGELEIKKPSYYDTTLRLGIEENGASLSAPVALSSHTPPSTVRRQVNAIADDAFVQAQWANGKNVSVIGWVYSLRTGLIRDLAISRCLGGSCYNEGRLDGYGSLQS